MIPTGGADARTSAATTVRARATGTRPATATIGSSRATNYRWRTGGYLPAQYRTYYVRDPHFYGLREAPRGYRYVHAGNDILLIAVATGLIASVLSNVY